MANPVLPETLNRLLRTFRKVYMPLSHSVPGIQQTVSPRSLTPVAPPKLLGGAEMGLNSGTCYMWLGP